MKVPPPRRGYDDFFQASPGVGTIFVRIKYPLSIRVERVRLEGEGDDCRVFARLARQPGETDITAHCHRIEQDPAPEAEA